MDHIEHWERSARLMVAHGDPNPEDPEDVALAGECLTKALGEVDSLRQQLRGAVEDRAVLRQMVEDIASQIAGEGMTGWAKDIRDDLHRLGGGQ